ncbi:type II toxin-antitoxin system VapC family toxin [Pseudonocardia nigra]|uniref:type II toxin-antitoxin system VapC family toxin n=1 Tax=Pseudonocardia nigra TaxID=1921578 RepID=UPI001C5FE434|nr:type II toxin-antitoxin system VapC family toxin [Pseudonocardia nigra]
MSRSHGAVVIDSAAVVAILADRQGTGEWVAETISGCRLLAPRLMPYEAGNSLRRRELAGKLSASAADRAHAALSSLQVELWPSSRTASRAWELRGAVTYYDASYVALAEMLDAPLVTLDRRLARAPSPRCAFLTPPEA